jgi:ActR/RegA family two-component response regulator
MERRTLLVVDDKADFARSIARRFSDYEGLVATDGAAAIAHARARRLDNAIVDLFIQNDGICEWGVDVIVSLRRIHPPLQAVILTGADLSHQTHRELARIGVLAYLKDSDEVARIRNYFDGIEESASVQRVPTPEEANARYMRTVVAAYGSMSAAARRIGRDRRTIQRILKKNARAPGERPRGEKS